MRINKLVIENFKGFKGRHEINFLSDKKNVIIGTNGAGKTSILDSLAILMQTIASQLKSFPTSKRIAFSNREIFVEATNTIIEGQFSRKKNNNIKGTFFAKQKLNNHPVYNSQKGLELIDSIKKNIGDISNGIIPFLAYYQTERKLEGEGLDSYTVKLRIENNRNQVYSYQSFDTIVDYNSMLNWYLQQINIQNNEKVKKKDLSYELPAITSFSTSINKFINALEDSKLSSLSLDVSKYGSYQTIILDKGDVKLEFPQLSAGEKMLIGLVLDMAYKMSIANPKMDNPLLTDGIVLIDEIELHLHPKWQMTVLDALSTVFPNIQFIVSTHSPLVINHVLNEQLIVLNDSNILQGSAIHNTYGQDVNSIVEDLMGGLDRPREIKSRIEEIDNILAEEEIDTRLARKKLEELRRTIDPNDYDIVRLETLITIEEDEDEMD
ncbi:MAG: AAA family ATPase [Chitinophagales bacterium]